MPRLSIAVPQAGQAVALAELFRPAVDDVWMEIGFGTGEHLLAQAQQHPKVGFIGCEPYLNGVAAMLSGLADARLDNVRFFADDARRLLPALPSGSIGRLFILFPDPWPKSRHHGRRLINVDTIGYFARILREGGELRVASDHGGYVRWVLEHLTRDRSFCWSARRADDWRQRPEDAPPTRYEEKAMARGQPCMHLSFRRTSR